jgi:hypothetical protein
VCFGVFWCVLVCFGVFWCVLMGCWDLFSGLFSGVFRSGRNLPADGFFADCSIMNVLLHDTSVPIVNCARLMSALSC